MYHKELFKIKILLLVTLISGACIKTGNPEQKPWFTAVYNMNNLPVSGTYAPQQATGKLDNPDIDEASGLAVSRQDPDLLWTHNDRGDFNRIFLIHRSGRWLGTFRISDSVNRDWEDMSIGRGPVPGIHYLYIAEIGDNNSVHEVKHIYRIPEPDVRLADTTVADVWAMGTERISFTYPDRRMDAETLLLDPWTGDLYIVTKREYPVTIYKLPYPQNTSDTVVAVKYGTLPFTRATGGDISADGRQIAIKTNEQIFLWTREEGESMKDAWLRPPYRLHYIPEPQGEALAFTPDSEGFYTLSEQVKDEIPVVYFFQKN